jgi:RHS repeat-associated protein
MLTSRTIFDGANSNTWTYAFAVNNYQVPSFTDTDPLGNQTVYTGSCGTTPRVQYYAGAASSGTLLKTENKTYQGFLPLSTSTTWPNGQTSSVTLTYDPGFQFYYYNSFGYNGISTGLYGVVTSKIETDYNGSTLRQTSTEYEWQVNPSYLSANLLSFPYQVGVSGSGGTASVSCFFGTAQSCTTYGYDGIGNQTSVTQSLNTGPSPVTHYVYNGYGMPTSMTDPNNNTSTYGYDSTGVCMNLIKNPLGQTAQFICDSNTEQLTNYQDQNGQPTQYHYDVMLRPTQINYPDLGQTSITYNYSGNVFIGDTVTKKISSSQNFVTTQNFDGLGRLKQIKTTVPTSTCSSGYSYSDATYDGNGRQLSISNPYCTTGDATYGVTKTYYDVLNRVTSVVEQDNSTVSTDFSAFPCIMVTDEAAKKRKSCSDGLGRMTSVSEDPSGLNYQTSYGYDALDNLLSVMQSGSRQRAFAYDSLSRLTQATNPESGAINYTYDANGNVKTKADARSITTTYSYDALNRQTFASHSDGSQVADITYDGCSFCAPFTSTNSVGRLVRASNDVNAAKFYSYDAMGRVTYQTSWTPSNSNVMANPVSASYDLAGDLASLTFPSGRKVTYQYNNAMQPTQVRFDSFNGTAVGYNYLSSASYAPTGAPTSLTLGSGVIESASYNDRLQPCNLQIASGTFTWLNRANNFYPTPGANCQPGSGGNNGNVMSIADKLQSNRTQTFAYDNLNRISTAQSTATSGADCWGQSFGYDAWANLLAETVTKCSGTQLSVGVNANNRITNTGFSYDGAGNLLTDGIRTYAYNAENQIITLNSSGATYTYDAQGNRVRKDVSGSPSTEYIHFNGQVIAEKNVSSGDWSDYIYAGSRRIARGDTYEDRIYTYGTVCGNCGWQAATFTFPNYAGLGGYVIQSGDLLVWRQWQTTGAHGGIAMWFSDGSVAQWVTYDQDGQQIDNDGFQQQWHYRRVDMSQHAGKTISSWSLVTESTTQAGSWGIFYQDMALVSRDGTVHPIYARQQTVPLTPGSSSGMTGVGYTVNHWNDPNGAVYWNSTTNYYHGDHLGSSRLTTSVNGYPVWSAAYLPFGQEWNPQPAVDHYKFTGKERDSESGLDNFGARYDSSQYGRFMSPDPDNAGADPSNPQSWNMYSYVQNNPLNAIDPNGLDCIYVTHTILENTNDAFVQPGDCTSSTDDGYYVDGTVQGGKSGVVFSDDGNVMGYLYHGYDDPLPYHTTPGVDCIGDCSSTVTVTVDPAPATPTMSAGFWQGLFPPKPRFVLTYHPPTSFWEKLAVGGGCTTGLDPELVGPVAGPNNGNDRPEESKLTEGKYKVPFRRGIPGRPPELNRSGKRNAGAMDTLGGGAALVGNQEACLGNASSQ